MNRTLVPVLAVIQFATLLATSARGQTNVLAGKPVSLAAGTVNGTPLSTIVDGVFLPKGTQWQNGTVWWNGTTPTLHVDLQGTYTLRSGIVQADDNDSLLIEYRDLGSGDWFGVWTVPTASGGGMQTRPNPNNNGEALAFASPVTTDAVRIRAISGDNSYSLSEVQIFDEAFLPLPAWQRAVALNGRVDLAWQSVTDPSSLFQHYAVYRSTTAFANVDGMTPLATIASISTEAFADSTAVNDTQYHYAVTTVGTDGTELKTVASIGPRTPRDETDLQVVSISRLPRYPRYSLEYTHYSTTEPGGFGPYNFSGVTGLTGGQTPATQRWPNNGETVTYRATIRNRGTNQISSTIDAEWRVDGMLIASPAVPLVLPPNATATVDLTQVWDGIVHEIRFRLMTPDVRPENNERAITTGSVAFLSYVDRSYMEDFREDTPQFPMADTDDFIDWLNLHMDRFNALFANAGTPKRVHFDLLEVLDDPTPDPTVDTIYFAYFPFRYRSGEESYRVVSGYYVPAEDIDYGLLHEMGHQLGLIDIYQLDLPSDRNQVSGLGYNGAPACLMHGVSNFISQHSALAMTHWQDTAHGYFGQYLYGIPAQVQMRFIGLDGLPLHDAAVTVYQMCDRPGIGPVLTDQIKFQGTTDGNGLFALPNVPINPSLIPPTYVGDALNPNPFGYVNNGGTNGVLHFKIEYDGVVDYTWLDLTECNQAYYTGQTSLATFERFLQLASPCQGASTLFGLSFNGTLSSVCGQAPLTAAGVALQPGIACLGAHCAAGNELVYPNSYPFYAIDSTNGTLEVWVKPDWNGNDGITHPILAFGGGGGMYFAKDGGSYLKALFNRFGPGGQPEVGVGLNVGDWTADQWHHIAFTWSNSPKILKLYVDGLLAASDTFTINLPTVSASAFQVGGEGTGESFVGVLDEMRISNVVLSEAEIMARFVETGLRGDLDCDGFITESDSTPLVLSMIDPTGYAAAHPGCAIQRADLNCDGQVNGLDIQTFVGALLGG